MREEKPFCYLYKFDSSPIVSLHLWFDKEFMDTDFLGLIDQRVQWIFNRRRLMGGEKKSSSYLSAVISGAYEFVDLQKEQLAQIAIDDLHRVFPQSLNAQMIHSVVIKEKRATFSPLVDIEQYRPSTNTPIQNFYIVGDWTDTGLPATIEGAVMSGFNAASLVL